MLQLKSHLKTLVETHAPSGHEHPMRSVLKESWKPYVDEFEQDKVGSLIGIKRATHQTESPFRIMLAAHMDEIGLMVRDIVDGFVYVHKVNGVDPRTMISQPVVIHGKEPVKGIVASIPPHMTNASQRSEYPSFDQLIIDVGLPEDEVNEKIQIGDLITIDVPLIDLMGKHVAAKAIDNRASVAALTVCLDELQKMHHHWDVYAVATVQEESQLLGAQTAAQYIQPDIAIALDVTFGTQPGVDSDTGLKMGGGVAIAIGANLHPNLVTKIRDVASKYEIKNQTEVIPARSGTDAWPIQVACEGIPTALLSIPIRNMHSPVEMLNLKDIERTGYLLAQFISTLDAEFLDSINWNELEEDQEKDEDSE